MKLLIRHKLLYLIIAILYVMFYDYIYKVYLVPVWGYMGAVYYPIPQGLYELFVVLGSLPIIFYKGFNTISSALTIFVYIFIYIPILETSFVGHTDTDLALMMAFVCFLCMVMFFVTDNVSIGHNLFRRIHFSCRITFSTFEKITYILFIIVLLVSGVHNFTFVNFLDNHSDMYELRATYGQARSVFAGYLISWFKYGFLPVLFVAYCKQRKVKKICLGCVLYFLMFMIDMQKITFFLPIVIMIAYFGLNMVIHSINIRLFPYLIACISTLTLVLYLNIDNDFIYGIAAIFIMRTLCIEGWLFNIYIDFFKHHDYTYYTHVNFIDAFFGGYPFGDMPLGNAVTEGGMNANACFMITDGYAALGVVGFIIAAICFIVFKSFFNNLSECLDKVTLFCMSIPALAAMLNVSLFTAIFSCGYMWIFLLVCWVNFEDMDSKLDPSER